MGLERRGRVRRSYDRNNWQQEDADGATGKPFDIEKKRVYEAYKAVKSNGGAAGVDGQTIEQFEADLKNNLYKIWNLLSTAGACRLHSQKVWRPADFRCAHGSRSRGADGRQARH